MKTRREIFLAVKRNRGFGRSPSPESNQTIRSTELPKRSHTLAISPLFDPGFSITGSHKYWQAVRTHVDLQIDKVHRHMTICCAVDTKSQPIQMVWNNIERPSRTGCGHQISDKCRYEAESDLCWSPLCAFSVIGSIGPWYSLPGFRKQNVLPVPSLKTDRWSIRATTKPVLWCTIMQNCALVMCLSPGGIRNTWECSPVLIWKLSCDRCKLLE